MKKILSLSLALAMLLSVGILLTSCSEITVDSMKKNASEALTTALMNSYSELFGDEIGIFRFFAERSDQKEINTVLILDESYAELKSASRNESSFAYRPIYEFIFANAGESTVSHELGRLTSSEVELLRSAFASNDKNNHAELSRRLLALCEETVVRDTVSIGSKRTPCVVASYKITNNSIKKCFELIYSELLFDKDGNGELKKAVDSVFKKLDMTAEVMCEFKICISEKDKRVKNIEFECDVEAAYDIGDDGFDDSINLDGSILITDDSISANNSTRIDGERLEYDLDITKAKEDKDIIYTVKSLLSDDYDETAFFELEFRFSEDGALMLSVKDRKYDGELDSSKKELLINGSYKVEKLGFTLEFSSVEENESKRDISLAIKVSDKAAEQTLEKKEWDQMISDIKSYLDN